MDTLSRLNDILAREAIVYTEIEQLEAKKTGAIIDRDGAQMDTITRRQDELIAHVGVIENERKRMVDELAAMAGLPKDSPLSHLVKEDDPLSPHIKSNARTLRKTMERLCAINAGNARLIEDNLEFFRLVLGGVKESTNTGYSRDGSLERSVRSSAFLNITV